MDTILVPILPGFTINQRDILQSAFLNQGPGQPRIHQNQWSPEDEDDDDNGFSKIVVMMVTAASANTIVKVFNMSDTIK